MGLELTTDKYPPITSQTRYPLRHAASRVRLVFHLKMFTNSKVVDGKKILYQYLPTLCTLNVFCLLFIHMDVTCQFV